MLVRILKTFMKTFKDLDFKKIQYPLLAAIEAKMHFDNGYGVSVVMTEGTLAYQRGLWEVGILYAGELTKDSGVTDEGAEVVYDQNEEGVTELMKKVQAL